MSYAIRKDGQGWRAVNEVGDVMVDEVYSSTPPIKTPLEIVKEVNSNIQRQIRELEVQVTARLMRDFILRPNVPISRPSGSPKTPAQIIADIDAQIETLRATLQP